MYRCAWAVIGLVVVACEGNGNPDGGEPGLDVDVVQFGFDAPLGTQRTPAWKWPMSYEGAPFLAFDGPHTVVERDAIIAVSQNGQSEPVIRRTEFGDPPAVVWETALPHDYLVLKRAADGGFVAFNEQLTTISTLTVARVGADGALAGTWEYPNAGLPLPALLPSGDIAVEYDRMPPPGSVEPDKTATIALFDATGALKKQFDMPTIVVPESDIGEADSGDPTLGAPFIYAMQALPDGDLVVAGAYQFLIQVDCAGNSCAKGATSAFVAKLDGDLKLQWSTYLGAGLATPSSEFRSFAVLSDGSILATGIRTVSKDNNHEHRALAARLEPSGKLAWAHAYDWGVEPVPTGAWTYTFLTPAADAAGGGARAILTPPAPNACRLVSFAADGTITSVQPLEHTGCQPVQVVDHAIVTILAERVNQTTIPHELVLFDE